MCRPAATFPIPTVNPKFAHKLSFLDEMQAHAALRCNGANRMILVGDLNVAPLEHDVWSHKQMLRVVSHTPIECEKLVAAQKAGGWVDAMRMLVPEPAKLYTWWSYRSPDWETADKGRRLDHIWVAPALADRVAGVRVLRALARLVAAVRPRAGDGDAGGVGRASARAYAAPVAFAGQRRFVTLIGTRGCDRLGSCASSALRTLWISRAD